MTVVRLQQNRLRRSPNYAVEFLDSSSAKSWMDRHVPGQAVKGINLGDLRKVPIPLPPLPLQEQFAKRVTEIRELESARAASHGRLEDLFQSLLHRACSGEL